MEEKMRMFEGALDDYDGHLAGELISRVSRRVSNAAETWLFVVRREECEGGMITECCRRGTLGSLRSRKRMRLYMTPSLAYDGGASGDARGVGGSVMEGPRRVEDKYHQARPKTQGRQTIVPSKMQCFR
ncbi:hypothetical protein TRVL_03694 [Trypanosoma vivax]|nr:hypothetical protein TRVL_03694 [Trypanosoma vivax]